MKNEEIYALIEKQAAELNAIHFLFITKLMALISAVAIIIR